MAARAKKNDADRTVTLGPLVSAPELAEEWGCHPTTVGRILSRAGIEPIVFGTARNALRRFRRSDVNRYLAETAS